MNNTRRESEELYPDIKLFLCCRNELHHLLDKHPQNINIDAYKASDYAISYEIKGTL